jgi:hypothetical protein
MIGCTSGSALGRLTIVFFPLFVLFFGFRVAIPAMAVLTIHKRLRPSVVTDCHFVLHHNAEAVLFSFFYPIGLLQSPYNPVVPGEVILDRPQARAEDGTSMFVILWEYEVKSECEESFRKVYGPEGPWVQLFRNDQQYKGTRLLRDALRSEACITMDQWESKQAYAKFKSTHMEEYAAIDRETQKLTLRERYLGAFSMNAED